MATFEKIDKDISTTVKIADEINDHLAYIKTMVEMWIRCTPRDNLMLEVFSDVKYRLERIKYLNDNMTNSKSITTKSSKEITSGSNL